MNVSHAIPDDIKHFQDFSTSGTWTLFCLYKLATKNLLLATIFLQLVAKRRPSDFFNFEPCIKSHARSTGHIQAQEAIFAKERPTEAPLPRALLLVTEEVRQKMKKLFDVAYMVAKLELLFTVDPSLCSLEKEHAVLLVEYSIHF